MSPRFSVGDLVSVALKSQVSFTGMVISVRQSSAVPDAAARGIIDQQRWEYWVYADKNVVGPVWGSSMRKYDV